MRTRKWWSTSVAMVSWSGLSSGQSVRTLDYCSRTRLEARFRMRRLFWHQAKLDGCGDENGPDSTLFHMNCDDERVRVIHCLNVQHAKHSAVS